MRGTVNKAFQLILLSPFCILWHIPAAQAAHLKPETVKAWDAYLTSVERQEQDREQGTQEFLALTKSAAVHTRIERGEVIALPVHGSGAIHVPSGQVHHWIGVELIKGASLSDITDVTRHYERYPAIYQPAVIHAKTTSSTDAEDRFSMRLFNRALVGGMSLDIDYRSSFQRPSDHRLVAHTHALQVCEIEHFGQADERKLAPDLGRGYLWRIASIARMEQTDEGVVLELETLVLSRDVPVTVRWLADPIIRRVSEESITKALAQTRDAVMQNRSVSKASLAANRALFQGAR